MPSPPGSVGRYLIRICLLAAITSLTLAITALGQVRRQLSFSGSNHRLREQGYRTVASRPEPNRVPRCPAACGTPRYGLAVALGRNCSAQSATGDFGLCPDGKLSTLVRSTRSGRTHVIVVPFTDEELQGAVLRAAKSFKDRFPDETEIDGL